ncbi:hypothetical protein A0H81_00007 [Grifola frondosa]|uniref:Uncharacterized protein n=1 Tax=Grifola frondosa TaxID=5627 RepID=A0A1C7MP40_GRIFR|nr:hypothetical protein A0H81_00007 [Grifola frondosa]
MSRRLPPTAHHFGSPQASPTAASTTSLLSPTLTSPGFPPTSGAATAVGQNLESEPASHDTEAAVHSDGYSSTGEEQHVGQNPLVEDDEGTQSRVSPRVTLLVDTHAAVSEPTPSTSTSSSLHMSAITEKRMIFSTLPTPEQILPPYTPMSSSSQASSSGSTPAGQQRLPRRALSGP